MSLHPIKPWQNAPFLRLLIPLMLGILSAYYWQLSLSLIRHLGILAIVSLIFFSLIPIHKKFSWVFLAGAFLQLLLFVLGVLLLTHQSLPKNKDWLGYQYSRGDSIWLVLQEPLIQKRKSWKALSKVIAVKHQGKWMPARSKILLYLPSEQLARELKTGDELILSATLQKIRNNMNQKGFDYPRWLAFQQIYFQIYLPRNAQISLKKNQPTLRYYLYRTRDQILSILKKAIPEKSEQAVAEALLIGYKEDLDKQVLQSYSNTGVVHIIAISGLHLAMIYGLLLRLLDPLGNGRIKKYLRATIILIVLWGFSFITGGAAAILRSALGFSFLLLGNSLGYQNNTLNALAASAFFLLVYDPFLIWDLGFQLSYLAVLGIHLFSRSIENWFCIQNKILQIVWQLNSVTLAAQVFTLPLLLYQFHQFPNLFLYTNFLVVPLSGIILYAELLLLLISPFPVLLKWSGQFTGLLIAQMNQIIERTNRIPFALTQNISISLSQTLLCYLLIISLLIWLSLRQPRGFLAALSTIFIWVLFRAFSF